MNIIERLFTPEYCDYIFNKIDTTIPINKTKEELDWWMWSIWRRGVINSDDSINIKLEIENEIRPKLDVEDYKITWIQMSQYDNGRYFRKHLDAGNNETLIIILSDGFVGGDTLLDGNKVKLNKGDAIFFSGYKVYHEVTKVTNGTRKALIVWFKPKTKTLI